jgi:hypothetical protein
MIALSEEFRSHHDRSRAIGPGGLAARGGTPAGDLAHGAAEGAALGAHRARAGRLLGHQKVRAQLARTADPARKTGGMATPTPPFQPPPRPAAKPLPIGAPAPALDPPPSGASYHNARTANEVLKAQERKLRLEERKGQLVDKARAAAGAPAGEGRA